MSRFRRALRDPARRHRSTARKNRNFRPCLDLQELEARRLLAADVVISEIMHHAASNDPGEEYVELYNRGDAAADLIGWHFDKGVTYTFTGGSLAPGGYVVVASNLAKFAAKYPG